MPLVTPDVNGRTYIDRTEVPKDPWGNEYGYRAPSGLEEHIVLCYGADGKPAGEGDDRDLTNKMIRNGEY